MKIEKSNVSRRGFIRKTAAGAAGLMAVPLARKAHSETASPQDKSRVVVVRHDDAYQNGKFNQAVIQTMMNAGITELTGIRDVGGAWKSVFPEITSSSIIAIKINCLFQVCTHKEVTTSVTEGLKRMVVDGNPFPANNIIVWDRDDGALQARGYTINKSKTGVRYFGTPGFGSISYSIDEGDKQKLSSIITDTCDFLINMSVLKNHSTGGVTLSMKNHYGSISNVGGPHMHGSVVKILPSISALAPVRQKQVICICDAIIGVRRNGPDGPATDSPKSLILSKDLVAHDYTGAKMLESFGCTSADVMGAARHVYNASQPPYSLGTCDPAQIEKIEVNNPTETASGLENRDANIPVPKAYALRQTYPNPFNGRTLISYVLPENRMISIRIFNAKGRAVRTLFEGNQGPGSFQTAWDSRMQDGHEAPSGVYLCVLEAGRIRRTVKMQLIQ
jgi:uncharacterized protein (DUF362 family)